MFIIKTIIAVAGALALLNALNSWASGNSEGAFACGMLSVLALFAIKTLE